jgi:hypothetical protein
MLQNDASNDIPILTETFKDHNGKDLVKVCVNESSIKVYNLKSTKSNPDKIYYMRDVAGCSVGKSPKQNDLKAYLTIYMYPRVKANNSKRKREVAIFEYSSKESYENNLEIVKNWSEQLKKMLSKDLSGKPFLVYINPNSGSGKARNLFLERVKPIWAEASIPYAVVILTKSFLKNLYSIKEFLFFLRY